ncbi:hypothetical protein OSTOST_12537, partial [Ostertagia ostertagi]
TPKDNQEAASPTSEQSEGNLPEEFQEVIGDDDLLLTCAGSFSEEESLLLWRKEPISGLWINDPIPPLPVQDLT